MDSPRRGVFNSLAAATEDSRIARLAVLFVLGIIASIVAFSAAGQQPAYAAGIDQSVPWQSTYASADSAPLPPGGANDVQSGNNPSLISPTEPFEAGDRGNARCGNPPKPPAQEDEEIWTATLTVGEASDSFLTYRGYIPGNFPDEGDLDTTSFTHEDVNYEVLGLYVQETITNFRQLVLFTDKPLPDGLTLTLGDDEFPVSSDNLLGSNTRIYGWPLEDNLRWTSGQVIDVAMLVDSE